MHERKSFPLAAALLLAVLFCQVPAGAQSGGDKLQFRTARIERYNFSSIDKDAQMWSGVHIASNNKVYIGLCTHADAATVYEFDIATRTMRQLANLTELLDERGRAIWTNGKIHVQMQELDGYVYFGSFCEDNGPPAIDANSYRGPYWFRIEMASGKVEPLSRNQQLLGPDRPGDGQAAADYLRPVRGRPPLPLLYRP